MISQSTPTERREALRQRYLRFAHRCVADGNDALAASYFRMAAAVLEGKL